MSDIVIRGIEMPKDKPLNLSIYPNGEVVLFCIQGRDVYDNECNYGDYKHKKIAVELPPHGELVERDKISSLALEIAEATQQPTEETIFTALREVPVILGATE